MQRIAIIDIGSNSARLVISQIYSNGAYNMVFNQKETLRLSQRLTKEGWLDDTAFALTLSTMQAFAFMCRQNKADKIIAVATAAIRNAPNGPELVKQVAEKTGINLHILPGTAEAYLSFLGTINTLNVKEGILFDLGGGSTELVLFRDRQLIDSVSIPMGAVNTTAMFNLRGTMSNSVWSDVNYLLSSKINRYGWLKDTKLPLIGVGGTARTVARIVQKEHHYPTSKIHNFVVTAPTVRSLFKRLRGLSLEDRKKIPGLSAERADIILGGMSIISFLLDLTGSKKVITSGCGLREGLFYDYYARQRFVPLIADDILETSTWNVLRLYSNNIEHCVHVADLAMTMFDNWCGPLGINRRYRRLMRVTSLLHDIGITINYYSHARHSAYMILNAKLFGLTHAEQMMCAVVAAWHNGQSKSYFRNHVYRSLLTEKEWEQVGRMAVLLGLAECLDYTESAKIAGVDPYFDGKKAVLEITATDGPVFIELHQLEEKKPWFRKTFDMDLDIKVV
ncbi:MAG: Ppx/GppA phosphatase family protein [Succiniclasticum sp.]|jgi:exopolyphosphatase/guanosine-5'-triphosphate,3'-diphosphate pyrophosphatase|nr:Ppx/GppA phosphatase family protein [Succiniclasticum sp.]MEE3479012.1 Ppx/GppA phosphatase family protein [Succiniclasticum sp.]